MTASGTGAAAGIVAVSFLVAGLAFARWYRDRRLTLVVGLALAGRVAAIAVQSLTGVFGREDVVDYEPYFGAFAEALRGGDLLGFLAPHVPVYTVLYPGWLYAGFGPEGLWLVRLANAVVSLAVVVPLDAIVRQVWGRPLKPWQVGLVLLWPTYVRYSIEVGRMAPSILLALGTVALFLVAFERPTPSIAVAAVLVGIANAVLRVWYVFFGVFLCVVVVCHRAATSDRSTSRVAWVIGGGALLATTLLSFWSVRSVPSLSLGLIVSRARNTATGGSAYLPELYPATPYDLLWYLPVQGFYFLFSPMPWDVTSIPNAFAPVASLLAWTVLALVVVAGSRHWRRVVDDWRLVAVVGTVVLTSIGFGAATKNAGGALRWRLPITLVLLAVTTSLLTFENHDDGGD